MSAEHQHQRLLQNAYYAGVLNQLNLNSTLEENIQTFATILPYYDAMSDTLPVFSDSDVSWENMWHYLSDRSYGLQYKTLILNAHYAGTLVLMNPNDVMTGDWEVLAAASNLPVAPSYLSSPFDRQF